ncbi:hypothetical protein [Zymobacter sp. IVIA_5232.4 C2]|uniref:hypothetical protein n=1 Tax=Zymobacter sp. IVIA_5232.4 C2 TaxID=3394855 RepID=UPI0039C08D81
MSNAQHQGTRAGFLALRDELQARHADLDLAEVWDGMKRSERKAVLLSATIIKPDNGNKKPDDSSNHRAELLTTPLLQMAVEDRVAIRHAIHRMSAFASGLKDRCHKHSASRPVELATLARTALDKGDMVAARHFISLIETAS